MWMETAIGERFADLRVKEAQTAGVEWIITACPDCLTCLEDSAKGLENKSIRVMDLVELVELSALSNSISP
jgi:Fe-S oxidoreductase